MQQQQTGKGNRMKNQLVTGALCALLLQAHIATAAATPELSYDIQTGDDLNRVCASPKGAVTPADRERLLVCGAYIRGYLGYYSVSRNLIQGKGFCLPDGGIAADTLRQLYVGVLEKKPQIRDYPAAVDLATILQAAYPCKPAPGK
jgi:hypothetical protein